MTLRFAENFTGYGTGSTGRTNMLAGVWATLAATCTPVTANPRGLGTAHLRKTTSGGAGGARVVLGGATTEYIVGAAFYLSQLPAVSSELGLFMSRDGANLAQCSVCVNTAGVIEVRTGGKTGTIVADSNALSPTPPIVASAYQFVEVFFTIGDSGASPPSGEIEVRVDGVPVIVATGIDTRGGTSAANAESVIIGETSDQSGNLDVSDVYIVVPDLTLPNDFLGDTQWLDLNVNADGALSGWTRNTGSNDWEMVDDTTPDGDTTYISAATAGLQSEFELESLPATVSEVVAVVIKQMTRKTDAGTANVQASAVSALASPVSVANGASRPITETYTYYRDNLPLDPATGIAWSPASVNAMRLRIEKTV